MAVRTHVVLPDDLVEEIDRIAGKRKRSEYIAEAIREKLNYDKLGKALEESAGILDPADYPEWSTPEKVSAWVRDLRRQSDESFMRKLGRDE